MRVDYNNYSFSTSITDALSNAETELSKLNETIDSIKGLKPECDKLDYALAASSGALCGVVDIFLVGKPGESPIGEITDKWFADRTMDFAKCCHPDNKTFDSHDSALRFLEKTFKVPYDQTGLGDAGKAVFNLNAKNHHFKSLAHNPSLFGLFFSILDQFDNSSHFVTEGQLVTLHKADERWELQGGNVPSKLFCGFANWIGHLISDVSGSQSSAKAGNRGMGIPAPLWSWINDVIAVKAKLRIPVTETDKAINELAINIFEKGFDMRFLASQAIPVFLNELLVRLVYSVRRLFCYFVETPKSERSIAMMWKRCEPFSNPSVKRMLTVAHGTFCMVDIGDAVVRGFVGGGGSFNAMEFVLRLNIVGIGRFTISLYGESKRAILYYQAKEKSDFAAKESVIVNNYIEGLKVLSHIYNDDYLTTFIDDFENGAYTTAFAKSVELADLRGVPKDRGVRTKAAIDKYFGGN